MRKIDLEWAVRKVVQWTVSRIDSTVEWEVRRMVH
jgi:hypothetical protein